MKSVFALFLFLGLGASSAQGTEILWLNLKSSFSYRDLSTVCSNKSYPTSLYFGAEVEGLEIKKAVFRDGLSSAASKIALTTEEVKGIVLQQDKNAQLWLKTVSMDSRLLTWMFFEAGGGSMSFCKPSQSIASIDPASFSFQFKIESLGEKAESDIGKFRGKLKDGAAYQVELQFSARPHQLYTNDNSEVAADLRGYPTPPWTRSVSAWGDGANRSSAQAFCQSDSRYRVRPLRTTCRNNGGALASSNPFCSICNKFGNRWRCSEDVRVRCSALLEDETDGTNH